MLLSRIGALTGHSTRQETTVLGSTAISGAAAEPFLAGIFRRWATDATARRASKGRQCTMADCDSPARFFLRRKGFQILRRKGFQSRRASFFERGSGRGESTKSTDSTDLPLSIFISLTLCFRLQSVRAREKGIIKRAGPVLSVLPVLSRPL